MVCPRQVQPLCGGDFPSHLFHDLLRQKNILPGEHPFRGPQEPRGQSRPSGRRILARCLSPGKNPSALFADSVRLFRDATAKTETSGIAPYQLGQAYEERRDDARAMAAYEQVLERAPPPAEVARRATNNLAKLWARAGRLGEAEDLLRRSVAMWPDDPKILGNLAEVVARQGRAAEAKRWFDELVRRFPDYQWGRTRYEARFGRAP